MFFLKGLIVQCILEMAAKSNFKALSDHARSVQIQPEQNEDEYAERH